MEVSGQLFAPAALPPGKEPRYPLDRRLGGPQVKHFKTMMDLCNYNVMYVLALFLSLCGVKFGD